MVFWIFLPEKLCGSFFGEVSQWFYSVLGYLTVSITSRLTVSQKFRVYSKIRLIFEDVLGKHNLLFMNTF